MTVLKLWLTISSNWFWGRRRIWQNWFGLYFIYIYIYIYIASFCWCSLETVKKWWWWIRGVLFLLYFLVFDCVLLPYPLSFFSSVLLSSFLLCSALLSLSSPHCLVVFPLCFLFFFFLSSPLFSPSLPSSSLFFPLTCPSLSVSLFFSFLCRSFSAVFFFSSSVQSPFSSVRFLLWLL